MDATSIDSAIAPLAKGDPGLADPILDLREAALKGDNPGLCIRCYFKIYARRANAGDVPARLDPLREFLERHLEVVARDEAERELERLPLVLEDASLEEHCSRTMREFMENRAYATSQLELSFQFKGAVSAA